MKDYSKYLKEICIGDILINYTSLRAVEFGT